MRIKTLLTTLLAVAAAALFVATVPFASGATSKASKASDPVLVTTKSVAGLGKILVNSAGRTLYMFVPDKQKKVTCVAVCAKIWPPLKGTKATAGGAVKKSLLGSDKDPAGGSVITYNKWPLYLYLGDPKSGTANGQALNMNGGLWYVLSPSGAIIKKKVSKTGGGGGGGSTTTTTSTTTSGPATTTTTTTTTSTTMGGACPPGTSDADNDGDQNAGGPDDGDGCL
jgi:predicted lipoprotein with Yx(FWY)xxD motif